jgi:hypothetical protein
MLVNVPALRVFVFKKFLTNGEVSEGQEEGWLVAVRPIRHEALQWTVLLESGALFSGLPLNALTHKPAEAPIPLSEAQFWDCLTDRVECSTIDFLRHMSLGVKTKAIGALMGSYAFTLDFMGIGTLADSPDEWKAAHIVLLDNGAIAAYPNNRILFSDAALTPGGSTAHYRVNTTKHLIEQTRIDLSGRWGY